MWSDKNGKIEDLNSFLKFLGKIWSNSLFQYLLKIIKIYSNDYLLHHEIQDGVIYGAFVISYIPRKFFNILPIWILARNHAQLVFLVARVNWTKYHQQQQLLLRDSKKKRHLLKCDFGSFIWDEFHHTRTFFNRMSKYSVGPPFKSITAALQWGMASYRKRRYSGVRPLKI